MRTSGPTKNKKYLNWQDENVNPISLEELKHFKNKKTQVQMELI